jgi:hypothetical protein
VLLLGPNSRGVPLEVVGVELAEGDLMIIHAMRLRERHLDDYDEVMRWRGQ